MLNRAAQTALWLWLFMLCLPRLAMAEERDWTTVRVADALHPVRDPFIARWQTTTAAAMAGPRAPVWFREPSTQMDVALRLAELQRGVVPIDPQLRDRSINAALAGATLGWQRSVRALLKQSEGLGTLSTIVSTAISPSVQVKQRNSGGPRSVHVDDVANRDERLAFAELDQAGPQRTVRLPSPPTFRTGSAIALFPIPNTADVQRQAPRQKAVDPSMSIYMQAENILVDGARIQSQVRPTNGRFRQLPRVQWTAMARQELISGWSVVGEVRGDRRSAAPTTLRTSVETRLPTRTDWVLRASTARIDRARDLVPTGPPIEHRIDLALRANLRWRLPADVRHAPRGQVLGARGRPMPELPPRGPNTPESFVRASAQRHIDAFPTSPSVALR